MKKKQQHNNTAAAKRSAAVAHLKCSQVNLFLLILKKYEYCIGKLILTKWSDADAWQEGGGEKDESSIHLSLI